MRKRLALFSVILVVLVLSLYFFVPQNIHISQVQYISVPPGAVIRCFNNNPKKEWWPYENSRDTGTINYKGISFNVPQLSETNLLMSIIKYKDADTTHSYISVNHLPNDSSYLYWECNLHCSLSPINRIQQYLKAKKIKEAIDTVLSAFAKYVTVPKNVYGNKIEIVKVPDSVLISEKKILPHYPEVTDIYDIINSLRQYASEQNAQQTNPPMLNIAKSDADSFSIMVALPINKIIKEDAGRKIKRLLYGGGLLTTESTGGIVSINKAFDALENYKQDYKLTSPAIPYQSLITDRSKITDSSKWVTKIYYPIY